MRLIQQNLTTYCPCIKKNYHEYYDIWNAGKAIPFPFFQRSNILLISFPEAEYAIYLNIFEMYINIYTISFLLLLKYKKIY